MSLYSFSTLISILAIQVKFESPRVRFTFILLVDADSLSVEVMLI